MRKLREEVKRDVTRLEKKVKRLEDEGEDSFYIFFDGGGLELLVCKSLNITKKELEIVSDKASDDEFDEFMVIFESEEKTEVSRIKRCIEIRNKYVPFFN